MVWHIISLSAALANIENLEFKLRTGLDINNSDNIYMLVIYCEVEVHETEIISWTNS
jgi:hypothetical protein